MRVDTVLLRDESRRSWSDTAASRPIRCTIWHAESARDSATPVVVLSHGTGGEASDLSWLAHALCEAGYLVASVDHHGNTSSEPAYAAEGFAFTWNRPPDLSVLVDYVIEHYDVDESRIGAAGFSLGGYTVAALLGATLDSAVLRAMAHGHVPLPPLPEFPDLRESLLKIYPLDQLGTLFADAANTRRDERIRAGLLLAPAIGQLVDATSLSAVTAPVQIYWGDADDNSPPELNAHRYLAGIPEAIGCSVGADVGHYVFVHDNDDPRGVRERVANDAVAFFGTTLSARA